MMNNKIRAVLCTVFTILLFISWIVVEIFVTKGWVFLGVLVGLALLLIGYLVKDIYRGFLDWFNW